jgi:large subunit ribosomal protein L10Ae
MASKLPTATVREAVELILEEAAEKKRNFQETIELQIGLKNYDTKKDKRFAGSVKLPHCPRPNMKVAILGNAVHIAEAEKLGVEKYDVDALKKFNKQKKPIKKFAKKYNAFLASDTIIKTIVSSCGRGRAVEHPAAHRPLPRVAARRQGHPCF